MIQINIVRFDSEDSDQNELDNCVERQSFAIMECDSDDMS